jgi:hypothetical protein
MHGVILIIAINIAKCCGESVIKSWFLPANRLINKNEKIE